MKKITDQELESLKSLTTEFNNLKIQLGDIALQEHGICLRVEEIKSEFMDVEKSLMDTYGADSIINMETGEIKEKEKDGEDK